MNNRINMTNITEVMTEDEFEEFLNESECQIDVLGVMRDAGTLLRQIDEIMFDEMYFNYINQQDNV